MIRITVWSRWLLLLAPLLLGMPSPARAQGNNRMEASITLDAKEITAGGTFNAKVKLDVKPGFHTYPPKQKDPKAAAFITEIDVTEAEKAPVERAGDITGPEPKEKVDPTTGTVEIYEDPVDLVVPLKIKKGTAAGKVKFTLNIVTQVCDEKGCVPFHKSYDFEVTVKPGAPPKDEAPPKKPEPAPGKPEQPGKSVADSPAKPQSTSPTAASKADPPAAKPEASETIWDFTLKGVFFGFFTLLTPCVFPMIPITVSYFLKQDAQGQRAVTNALVYTVTIIVAMTVIAFAFVKFFQELIQDWPTNLILGALFIYFALSLFGMYEITLPGFLTRWTAAGEAKGGYLGTVFMALTFTIISFSCVAPFLGGFAGATARERPLSWNLMGALGFALAFASPFFLLALFPAMIKKLPKSGSWLNTMKVVMGFLEVAAALKFFRAAELLFTADEPVLMTYDLVLGMYVTICLLCGFYLIGVYQLPHDEPEDRRIGVGRLIWSFLFLGLGFYLMPALFRAPNGEKLRPAGEVFQWIDSFLLPGSDTRPLAMSSGAGNGALARAEQKWFGFLDEALRDAKEKKRRIFVDFTGVT